MKKPIFIVLLLMATCLLYATEANLKENGTILAKGLIGDYQYEIRKFEMSGFEYSVWVNNSLNEQENAIYDDFINKNKIGFIKYDEEEVLIDIFEICFIEKTKGDEIWAKVSYKKIIGWINIREQWWNFYKEKTFDYLGSVKYDSKIWIIRKYDDNFYLRFDADTKIAVRDKPSSNGNIISILKYSSHTKQDNPDCYIEKFKTIEVAENEKDYFSDFWVKIEYESGKFGWIMDNGIFKAEDRDTPIHDLILSTPEYLFFYFANAWLFSEI